MSQIPLLTAADIQNVTDLIQHRRHLAHAIAFVTARFVPGAHSIRTRLKPYILTILASKYKPIPRDEDSLLTQLQVFAILYAYAPPHSSDADFEINHELSRWAVKSSVEMFALRVSLHRSVDDLRKALEQGKSVGTTTFEVRKYLSWLWLFIMSHHHSLLTRTPPTIREDASIRCAPALLENLKEDPVVRHVLAEVDLCLLWGQASRLDQSIGEWWCLSQNRQSLSHTATMLNDLDTALCTWSERWNLDKAKNALDFESEPVSEVFLGFLFRFTRFCISTYAISGINAPSDSASRDDEDTAQIPDAQSTHVFRSVRAAFDCCSFVLGLSPLIRDHARYLTDFGFAMIAFPCIFILRASDFLWRSDPNTKLYLDTIEDIAHIMIGLAIDSNHVSKLYGERILAKLAQARYLKTQMNSPNPAQNATQLPTESPSMYLLGSESIVTQNADSGEFMAVSADRFLQNMHVDNYSGSFDDVQQEIIDWFPTEMDLFIEGDNEVSSFLDPLH